MVKIRTTTKSDITAIIHVQKQSFGFKKGRGIANLVNALLHDPTAMPLLSLIAENDDQTPCVICQTESRLNLSRQVYGRRKPIKDS